MARKNTEKKYIFLVNPISGTRSKNALEKQLLSATKLHGANAIVLPTVASGDYGFVRQKIQEENYTDIIICGGDGTVNQVVSSLQKTDVNFGIIPLGSGNGLALAAGIPKSLSKAIQLQFTGKPKYVDAFMVNEQFACMLCGLGFDAKVAHDFAQQPKRGLITYTKQTLKNYFTAKSFRFELVVDDNVIKTDAFFISIANSNQFGNKVTIAPRASLHDGLLDIVVVPKMNKALLPFALIQQVSSGKLTGASGVSSGSIQYFQTTNLQLRNLDKAPLHIDGEPKETIRTFDIRVIPKCFKLIQA